MIKFPMEFEVEATATSGVLSTWESKVDELPPITTAIPPEFKGPGGGYSPEDLFALSVVSCVIATFKVYAEKAKLEFKEIVGKAKLTVDKAPSEAGLEMTHLDITLDVTGATDPEKTKKTLDDAIKDCAVSNSVKSGKTFNINIS